MIKFSTTVNQATGTRGEFVVETAEVVDCGFSQIDRGLPPCNRIGLAPHTFKFTPGGRHQDVHSQAPFIQPVNMSLGLDLHHPRTVFCSHSHYACSRPFLLSRLPRRCPGNHHIVFCGRCDKHPCLFPLMRRRCCFRRRLS
jgi:hypothetical protein